LPEKGVQLGVDKYLSAGISVVQEKGTSGYEEADGQGLMLMTQNYLLVELKSLDA
jgi:tRNA U34 5-carboxymethylaminomethyl modifying enzyme MnmG/GidA